MKARDCLPVRGGAPPTLGRVLTLSSFLPFLVLVTRVLAALELREVYG